MRHLLDVFTKPQFPAILELIEHTNKVFESGQEREVWKQVSILGRNVMVGWTIKKEAGNRAAHDGISLEEGIPVISNSRSVRVYQWEGEDREKTIGIDASGRLLSVVTEWLEEPEWDENIYIRLISVRFADAKELNLYNGQTQ